MAEHKSGQMIIPQVIVDPNEENLKQFQCGNIVLELRLMYHSKIVKELVKLGRYRSGLDWRINDNHYPTQGEDGAVGYCLNLGTEVMRHDGWVYRDDVENYLSERGMRLPNAAEALLLPAMYNQVGRGCVVVSFLADLEVAFIVRESHYVRVLDHLKTHNISRWYPRGCAYMGVVRK